MNDSKNEKTRSQSYKYCLNKTKLVLNLLTVHYFDLDANLLHNINLSTISAANFVIHCPPLNRITLEHT